MLESEYENRLEFFRQSILALPTTELKYHLFLLLTAIEQTNTQQTRDILAVSIDLTLQCQQFLILKQNSPELRNQIHLVNKRYDSLARLINKYDSNFVFYPHLLTIGCAILAIITGIFFAILGGVTGLATGIMNQQNPLKFFALGLLVGLCMGGAIGNRAPEYILETPLIRQLRFALRGLTENLRHLSTSKKSFHEYLDDVLEELLKKNFDGNQEKLEQFLQSRTSYQVATHPAQFVSKKLKGYVGQHAFIIIDIPNRKPFTLEFATSPSKTDKKPKQCITQETTGQTIAEMMALHRKMQETHACTYHYMANKMKPGEIDCLAYVLKLTDGVNQPRPNIQRFYQQNRVGNFLAFFINKLSTFTEEQQQRSSLLAAPPSHEPK